MRTQLTERKFNQKQLYRELEKIISNEDIFQLDLKDEISSFTLTKGALALPSILCIYQKSLIDEYTMYEIKHKFSKFFQSYNGTVGFAVSDEDQKWQNTTNIERYKDANKPLENLVLKLKTNVFKKEELVVDKECLPGHNHYVKRGLWFGSCWTMWFGNEYFNFISKESLLAFRDGFETKELEDGSVVITLYDDIWDFNNPENRDIQWSFRKKLGIDDVAHDLLT
ncbi:hypothetical protein [Paenibacillus sp. V4I7]|uniref:hypothetical protein n=1 Tax=Paenibacillus sp. V4I7 TaxID=3042307 RepID=UPI0027869627|nr:hypothetical protein [Paenibacillus sp. V4I7]MDQ0899379.1 hypothetical protein [Paenibacillus sp. V4I7]